MRGGICPKAVADGFRCIFSDQGVWYLDHLDVPWDRAYHADPLEGISDPSQQKLIIGGEVCMWGETADASNVMQTIWPRAATAAGMFCTCNRCHYQPVTRIRLYYFFSYGTKLTHFLCSLQRGYGVRMRQSQEISPCRYYRA